MNRATHSPSGRHDWRMARALFESGLPRREFLARTGQGFGSLALAYLLGQDRLAATTPAAGSERRMDVLPRAGHFRPQAKAVIQLVQSGGPPQMDLFDHKRELQKRHGQTYEVKTDPFQPGSEKNELLACPFRFRRYGECGMEMSKLIPHIGSIADEICLVRSVRGAHNNHPEAANMLATGKVVSGRPSLGAWISYALGTENQNLPGFIVLRDPDGYSTGGPLMSESGWLPELYGGTEFNSKGTPVQNLEPPAWMPKGVQRRTLEFLARLNKKHLEKYPLNSELETRIRNYELAARMQLNAKEVLDITTETPATLRLYGLDDPQRWKPIEVGNDGKLTPAGYAVRCLMARRLIEAGVRFVQVFVGYSQPWDYHSYLKEGLPGMCSVSDQASGALVKDLKSRGLLDSTVVLWAGEFGRLPVSQVGQSRGRDRGRDHNKRASSLWIAGGGVRRGFVYGATDDVGYEAIEDEVSMPDLLATIAHQMGLDHQQLSYEHAGRQEDMTDSIVTDARVHHSILT